MVWAKILYKRQPYPDNYSGGKEQFLSELRKNVSIVAYKYSDAVIGATNLVFHLNCVVLFFVLFESVSSDSIDENLLLLTCFSASFILYAICAFVLDLRRYFADHMLTLVTLLSFGYALTPVIRTLTDTISTDTIYAMSFISAAMSCVFHDYGVKAPVVSLPISLSSGLCSAIFMVSRLKRNSFAFVMLSIAFIVHACAPHSRNALFSLFPRLLASLSILISLITVYLVHLISIQLAITILVFQLFIIFVCPYILVRIQTHKRNIHGPWDEAVPSKMSH